MRIHPDMVSIRPLDRTLFRDNLKEMLKIYSNIRSEDDLVRWMVDDGCLAVWCVERSMIDEAILRLTLTEKLSLNQISTLCLNRKLPHRSHSGV